MSQIRVLIVEDEALIAEDIADYLSNIDYTISGIAYDYTRAVHELETNCPDLALLDVNLGSGKDGIQVAELIQEKYKLPFVFLTSYADKATLDRAKHTRPLGYIVKPFDERDLLSTLEIALYNFSQTQGPVALDLNALNRLLPAPLTKKEYQILMDLYQGKTNKQMAEGHFISVNTVKTHIKNIYDKMDVHTRSQTIARLHELMH